MFVLCDLSLTFKLSCFKDLRAVITGHSKGPASLSCWPPEGLWPWEARRKKETCPTASPRAHAAPSTAVGLEELGRDRTGWVGMPQPMREFSPTHFLSFLGLKYIFIICKMLWQDISKLNPMLSLGNFSDSVFYVPRIISTVVWGVRT